MSDLVVHASVVLTSRFVFTFGLAAVLFRLFLGTDRQIPAGAATSN